MKLLVSVMLMSAVSSNLFGAEEEPVESFQKHELAQAGCVAATNGNIPLMKALLQAGLPLNEPLYADEKGSPGWTALHLCCIHNQPAMMKWLVKHGANRDKRDEFRQRPIDMAIEKDNKTLCKLLAKPEEKETSVNGIPLGLFEELVQPRLAHHERPLFVSINGKDPDKDAVFRLEAWDKHCLPASNMEQYDDGDRVGYRHKKSKVAGDLMEIEITSAGTDPFEHDSYRWSIRRCSAPALAGGGSRGKIERLYGYWVVTGTVSWDE